MNNKSFNNCFKNFVLLIVFILSGGLLTSCHNHEHLQEIIKMPCTGNQNTNGSCQTTDSISRSLILKGDPDELFNIHIRIRGIVEQRTYPSGKDRDGMWQVGGQEGRLQDTANIYKLSTSNPVAVYYINAGHSNADHVFKIDTVVTIQSHGEAILTLTGLSVDGKQLSNQGIDGNPLKISSTDIKRRPFEGQYVQVNVLSQKKIKGT